MIRPKGSNWLCELLYDTGTRLPLLTNSTEKDLDAYPIFLDDKVGYLKLYRLVTFGILVIMLSIGFAYSVFVKLSGWTPGITTDLIIIIFLVPLIIIGAIYVIAQIRTHYRIKHQFSQYRWQPSHQSFVDPILQQNFSLSDIQYITIDPTQLSLEIHCPNTSHTFFYIPKHHAHLLALAQAHNIPMHMINTEDN